MINTKMVNKACQPNLHNLPKGLKKYHVFRAKNGQFKSGKRLASYYNKTVRNLDDGRFAKIEEGTLEFVIKRVNQSYLVYSVKKH
tara:strand:- start:412 stop:666 length:255 start_codon:yes stop_codon:yes gene_type:complete